MRFVSLVKHNLTLILDGEDHTLEPSGAVALVREPVDRPESVVPSQFGDVPLRSPRIVPTESDVYLVSDGEERPFPDPELGVILVVNAIVLSALRGTGRVDVVAPDTVTARRDGSNQVNGVYGVIPVS